MINCDIRNLCFLFGQTKLMKILNSLVLMAGFLALGQSAHAAVIANYDFEPNNLSGTQADIDGSAQTDWTTSILFDNAIGTGAVGAPNQDPLNRDLFTGNTGNFLALSSNREGDTGVPTGTTGESTWFTFDVTPSTGTTFDFTGQTASIDTYAFNSLGSGTSATDWTLYFSLDGGSSFSSLGTFAGATAGPSAGTTGPVALSWSLDSLGTQTGTVTFLLDPVSTAQTNGVVEQRATGFDNLLVEAEVIPTTSEPVPEPLTILGAGTAVIFGSHFKRKLKQKSKSKG